MASSEIDIARKAEKRERPLRRAAEIRFAGLVGLVRKGRDFARESSVETDWPARNTKRGFFQKKRAIFF
jgi:hypothetical protein